MGLQDIPQELVRKWRRFAGAPQLAGHSSKMEAAFDTMRLPLQRSNFAGGMVEDLSKEACGTCDRCGGEGFRFVVLENTSTRDLLQVGETCCKRIFGGGG